MSDDRFIREPGDDSDELHADRTHIDPKPRSWYNKRPEPFDLAAEVDKFLDRFCAELGIKRHSKPQPKEKAEPKLKLVEPPKAPTAEDWKKL